MSGWLTDLVLEHCCLVGVLEFRTLIPAKVSQLFDCFSN